MMYSPFDKMAIVSEIHGQLSYIDTNMHRIARAFAIKCVEIIVRIVVSLKF